MRAQRGHAVGCFQRALNQGQVVPQPLDHYRRPTGAEWLAPDDPDAGSGAGIEHRTQRDLNAPRLTCGAFNRYRHGRPQRQCGVAVLQGVAGFKGAGCRVCRFGEHAQPCRDRNPRAKQRRRCGRADLRAKRLGQLDHGFPTARTGKPGDDLPRRHYLAGLGQNGHDHPIGIGNKRGVLTGVACHPGLSVGRLELRSRRVCRRLHLIVGRAGHHALGCQVAIARLVRRGLHALRTGRDDGLLLGSCSQIQVERIHPIEHVAALDRLSRLNAALSDLASHPEGQIALHPCGDGAGEGARVSGARLHLRHPDDRRCGSWVAFTRLAAGHKEQRNNTGNGCEYRTAPHTVFRSGVSGRILFLVTNPVNSHLGGIARLRRTSWCRASGASACRADTCGSVTGFR